MFFTNLRPQPILLIMVTDLTIRYVSKHTRHTRVGSSRAQGAVGVCGGPWNSTDTRVTPANQCCFVSSSTYELPHCFTANKRSTSAHVKLRIRAGRSRRPSHIRAGRFQPARLEYDPARHAVQVDDPAESARRRARSHQ